MKIVIYETYEKECLDEDDIANFESGEGIWGDCHGYELEIDGEIVATYGDYYHDKGSDKCEGFIDGYCKAKGVKVPQDIERKERLT